MINFYVKHVSTATSTWRSESSRSIYASCSRSGWTLCGRGWSVVAGLRAVQPLLSPPPQALRPSGSSLPCCRKPIVLRCPLRKSSCPGCQSVGVFGCNGPQLGLPVWLPAMPVSAESSDSNASARSEPLVRSVQSSTDTVSVFNTLGRSSPESTRNRL